MTIAPKRTQQQSQEIYYPTSDGKPMAETELHRDQMIYCIEALRARFADDEEAYVSGNNFIYYMEGNNQRKVSPDCYVVFNVDKKLRDIYQVWNEGGQTPAVVFEFTSKSTKREDMVTKRRLYEQTLQVTEYILFDPKGEYLTPRLQGFRLRNGRYEPIALDDFDQLFSEELCLYLRTEGDLMRIVDPLTLDVLLTPLEQVRRAEEEALRAEAAEGEAITATRRAEAEARRANNEVQRAEAEARLRQLAEQRAEVEAQRAANLEAELTRLRAQLEAMQKPQS